MRHIAFIALSLLIQTEVGADVWRCGDAYFNSPRYGVSCKRVKSTKLCGVKGNKIVAPYKKGYSTVDHSQIECPDTEEDGSPLTYMPDKKKKKGQGKGK